MDKFVDYIKTDYMHMQWVKNIMFLIHVIHTICISTDIYKITMVNADYEVHTIYTRNIQ